MSYFIITFFVFILVGAFLVLFYFKYPKKLSTTDKKYFKKLLGEISQKKSSKEQILSLDILYHKILQKYGYKGTFGEILKSNPAIIGDINQVWKLHKLRNTLAHELKEFDEKFLQKHIILYTKEIQKIL